MALEIHTTGCADCSRGHTVVPAEKIRDLAPHSGTGYKVALCSDCATKPDFDASPTPDMKEWLERSGRKVTVWKIVPAHKCVSCFSEGKTTDATDAFEGVPMCSSCKESWDLNKTYLSSFEWEWGWDRKLGWAWGLAKLQSATETKKMVFENVVVY